MRASERLLALVALSVGLGLVYVGLDLLTDGAATRVLAGTPAPAAMTDTDPEPS